MSGASAKVTAIQRRYAETVTRERDFGLIVPDAFLRGIRHIGYKSSVEAIAELVDNSIQAYAERVDLIFGYPDQGSSKKPDQLAVIDDGHGMGPGMMRLAMMWGGTHRENDREGLGRFGYGLPSATVSIGRRFTIYSKLKRGRVYAVTLDLDLLEGNWAGTGEQIGIPIARPVMLPDFLANAIRRAQPEGWASGTIILIEKLDRMNWSTTTGLRRNLVRHFGVAYHKLLCATSIHIDGEQVRPIDPLFLDSDADFHAIDEDRAKALDPVMLRIDDTSGTGEVVLRYAWLPPSFGAQDKSRDAIGVNANARFAVIKQYHGIVFSRNGRLIDVQSRTPWTTFLNNDRYIRIEIEFSAGLDEAFGVTTSKQQVSVTPEMWDRLRTAGLHKAIEHLRFKVRSGKADRLDKRFRTPAIPTPNASRLLGVEAAAVRARENIPRLGTIAAPRSVLALPHMSDPTVALRTLLNEIERRSTNANAAISAEYTVLLERWADRLAVVPNVRHAVPAFSALQIMATEKGRP